MKAVLKVIPAIQYIQATKKRLKGENGLSLVEVLIVLLFISLIVGLVSTIYISASRTSDSIINITRSQIDARIALYRMSKDIREARNIIGADIDHISFISNVDADEDFEQIDYYLESENGYYVLMRTIDGGTERIIISHLIDNNIFEYFLDVGTPEGGIEAPLSSDDLGNIKLIGMDVRIDQSGSESLRTMDLDTLITLRNKI